MALSFHIETLQERTNAMFVFDIPTIAILSIVYTVIDFVIFKLIGLKRLTFYIGIFFDFIIPFLWIWWLPQSGLSFTEQLPIFLDKWLSLWVNLFNFVLSSIIGWIASFFLCMITGEKPEPL